MSNIYEGYKLKIFQCTSHVGLLEVTQHSIPVLTLLHYAESEIIIKNMLREKEFVN
ncbi:hypothetical protein JYU34_008608 [Plutella xylostella]|uniref:Uncharacterized protein n=1 Tax=Plutella xylostella TaxID=51655 RepID=A0ABQ7QLC9_PLUXY|nr:hypothetical protein JYU34_008608 [Plutella xylostella]